MPTTQNPALAKPRLVVIGGGISGLSAAHRLCELGLPDPRTHLGLLEAAPRLGGLIRTERLGGCMVESGPDSMVTTKPAGVELCRRLDLKEHLIDPKSKPSGTQVWHRGRLIALPAGFALIAPSRWRPLLQSPLFSVQGKARLIAERWIGAQQRDQETLQEFVVRRFGREAFDRVAEPILGGLFTADASQLSMKSCLPRFSELEAQHGSVTRGLRHMRRQQPAKPRVGLVTLRDGLETLVQRLATELPEACVWTGTAAERLVWRGPGEPWIVQLAGGREVRAAGVVLACPPHEAARLLREVSPELADSLGKLKPASCATVNLVYRRQDLGRAPHSYGFFVPRSAGMPILAASYLSEKFAGRAPSDRVLIRTFVGGALQPQQLEHSDPVLIERSHEALAPLLKLAGPPREAAVYRHPRSMPQLTINATQTIETVGRQVETLPGLFVCGASRGAIGIPDCIRLGEQAAERALGWFRARAAKLQLAI